MAATGFSVGTIDYIAPEQARGERATPRSDVYALAAVLCECLTGQVPYVRGSEERVLIAHLSEPPPRPSQVRSHLPAAIDEVVARGMAKDPDHRPSSAGELLLQARRALGGVDGAHAQPVATDTTPAGPAAPKQPAATRVSVQGDPGA